MPIAEFREVYEAQPESLKQALIVKPQNLAQNRLALRALARKSA